MNRKYTLKELNFKMKANNFDKALKAFQYYFSDIDEFNIKKMECIGDIFVAFDFEIVQDEEENIISLEPIKGEMPDWFYMFVKSIENYVEEGSRIKLMYEDGIMREFVFDDFCFEHRLIFESISNDDYVASEEEEKYKFSYMLLSRYQLDCKYYLSYGNRSEQAIGGATIEEHIKKMKKLYCVLPVKPIWLTMRRINEYEILMKKGKENF